MNGNSQSGQDRRRHDRRWLYGTAMVMAFLFIVSCAKLSEITQGPRPEQRNHSVVVRPPANFDIALKENQAALTAGTIAPDIGLYNTGFLLAHPSNPRKDYPRAVRSFQALVVEHPRSSLAVPAKAWIQVLEQQHKIADEEHKLSEERRALEKERELLAQERQKLNYAAEKSRQLDLEIEKRRRQALGK